MVLGPFFRGQSKKLKLKKRTTSGLRANRKQSQSHESKLALSVPCSNQASHVPDHGVRRHPKVSKKLLNVPGGASSPGSRFVFPKAAKSSEGVRTLAKLTHSVRRRPKVPKSFRMFPKGPALQGHGFRRLLKIPKASKGFRRRSNTCETLPRCPKASANP